MRVPGSDRQRKGNKIISCAMIFAFGALLVFSFSTTAAASGGEQGPKGWVKTDWYRVLNFAVLAAGLVFLLRKPLSQALRSRIAGIKEQLEDLERQKEAAEKKLVEYNQKLSDLEKEAENIVAEYIKQGNEAKARILKEAEAATEKLQAQARRSIVGAGPRPRRGARKMTHGHAATRPARLGDRTAVSARTDADTGSVY